MYIYKTLYIFIVFNLYKLITFSFGLFVLLRFISLLILMLTLVTPKFRCIQELIRALYISIRMYSGLSLSALLWQLQMG
jgi:hypothetical protein